MKRRDFLKGTATAGALVAVAPRALSVEPARPTETVRIPDEPARRPASKVPKGHGELSIDTVSLQVKEIMAWVDCTARTEPSTSDSEMVAERFGYRSLPYTITADVYVGAEDMAFLEKLIVSTRPAPIRFELGGVVYEGSAFLMEAEGSGLYVASSPLVLRLTLRAGDLKMTGFPR